MKGSVALIGVVLSGALPMVAASILSPGFFKDDSTWWWRAILMVAYLYWIGRVWSRRTKGEANSPVSTGMSFLGLAGAMAAIWIMDREWSWMRWLPILVQVVVGWHMTKPVRRQTIKRIRQ